MKSLIMFLGEGELKKPYTLTTFNMLQRTAFVEFKNDKATMDVYNSLKGRADFETLTGEELTQLMSIEEKMTENMVKAVRASLAKNHPDFIVKNMVVAGMEKEEGEKLQAEEEKRTLDLTKSLVDSDELNRIYNFLVSGRYIRSEQTIDETKEEMV